jgi:hypothetical protein
MEKLHIITHPGVAHRDEFVACSLIIAARAGGREVLLERREPTREELNSADVYVIDVGSDYSPQVVNFDHHQFGRNDKPCCAISLVMRHLSMEDAAIDHSPWFKFSEILDSKGPKAAAEYLGIDLDRLHETLSPIETQLLIEFGKHEVVSGWLIEAMNCVGKGIIEYLRSIITRTRLLSDNATIVSVDGVKGVDARFISRNESPSLGLTQWCEKSHPDAKFTITNDDRGNGFCLFRLDEDTLDFSLVENHPDVKFAHKGGFVAKTVNVHDIDLFGIIRKSIVPVEVPLPTEHTESESVLSRMKRAVFGS